MHYKTTERRNKTMIRPLTKERFVAFIRQYPDPEKWDEDAVWEANLKYEALFDKYFPMTYYTGDVDVPPELEDYPLIGTICLWHAIMDCVENKKEYEIDPRILELERDPNVCGIVG